MANEDPVVETMPRAETEEEFLQVDSYKLESYLGVTLTVNGQDWIKTGATVAMGFKDIPPQEQIALSLAHMREDVLGLAIDEAVEAVNKRLMEARGRRS